MSIIQYPKDFHVAVMMDKIPGVVSRRIVGRASDIQTAEPPFTIGFGNVLQTFALTNESWEVVSDNAADTSAGTGARTIQVEYLDDQFLPQSQTVALNGTTPVALASNCFRHQLSTILTAGSSQFNSGTISIRVAGGGALRGRVAPTNGISRIASYTIPSGRRGYFQATHYIVGAPGGTDVTASLAVYFYSSGVRRLGIDFTLSEPGLSLVSPCGFPILEEITIEVQVLEVSHNNADVAVLLIGEETNLDSVAWPVT